MEQPNTTGEGTEGATAGEEGGSTASRKARAAQFAERTASKRKDARKLIKMEVRSRLQKRKKVTLKAEEREEMNDRKKRARKHAERTTLKQRKAIREHRNREDE